MNTEQSFLEELLIVIVIFEKNPLETTALQSLNSIRKEAMLLLYDNSPLPHSHVGIEKVIYFHDPSNPGVSKAYNAAGNFAKLHNKKWLMLADQDTQFPVTIFKKYQQAIDSFPNARTFVPFLVDHIGIVSPFTFRNGKGKRIGALESGVKDLIKFRFANSGLLIATSIFEAVGGYDERFPLDYSDIVFADRLSKISTNFMLVDSPCNHHFSGSEKMQGQILIRRFTMFCQAVLLYKKMSMQNVPLYWVLLPRAIKLSLQKKNILFLVEAIRVVIK